MVLETTNSHFVRGLNKVSMRKLGFGASIPEDSFSRRILQLIGIESAKNTSSRSSQKPSDLLIETIEEDADLLALVVGNNS